MIPKIIHQMWVQGFDEMPEKYQQWSHEWKKTHTDWTLMFWDDLSAEKMLKKNYPQYVDMYNELIPVKKTDFFRLILLHYYGGVWLDTDTRPIRTLDELMIDLSLESYDIVVSYETHEFEFSWKAELLDNRSKEIKDIDPSSTSQPNPKHLIIASAFLMFKPHSNFIINFIEFAKGRKNKPVLDHYSTWVFTEFLVDFVNELNVKILDSKYCLNPVQNDDSYLLHMYDGTWLDRSKKDVWNII